MELKGRDARSGEEEENDQNHHKKRFKFLL